LLCDSKLSSHTNMTRSQPKTQVNYDNDYDWGQWNTTGKTRMLMEANSVPPMTQHAVDTKPGDSKDTQLSSLTSRMSGNDRQGLTVQGPSEEVDQRAGSIRIHDPTKKSLTGPSGTEMPPPSPPSGATREIWRDLTSSVTEGPPSNPASGAAREDFQDLTSMNKENNLGFNSLVWNGMALKNNDEEKDRREKVGRQQLSSCVVIGSQSANSVLNFRCAQRNRRRLQKRVKLKRKW